MSQAQQHAFAQATNANFIAAPPSQDGSAVTGKIVVIGLVITAEAAMKVTLSFSATNQKVFEFAGAGTIVYADRWEGDAGAALGLTVSAGTADVSADYVVEAA